MRSNWIFLFEVLALCALFLAPLSLIHVDSSLLFPYITSKNFVWRFAIAIAVTAWASLALLDVQYRFNWRNPVFVAFSIFMAVMLCANIFGYDPYRSFWSNAERMDGYIGLMHMYAFFIALCGLAQKPNIWRPYLYGMIGLGIVLGCVALGQDKSRADSWLGNPIYLASFMSFTLFASGYFMVAKEKLWDIPWLKEIVYGLIALFCIVVIFKSGTRGAILGLIFGGFATSIALACSATGKDAVEIWWRRIGITLSIGIVLIVTLFFAGRNYLQTAEWVQDNLLIQRAANFSLEDKTTKHRLANWEQAIDGFKERPILGWGQENYIHVFSKHYKADVLYNAEQWFDRSHNMLLDWLVFGGVFGLLSFLGLLGSALYVLWRKSGDYFTNLERSVLTGVIVGYVAQNFVAFDALATGIWITLFLAIIANSYINHQSKNHIDIERYLYALPVLWILCFVWVYQTVIVPRGAAHDFMEMYQSLSPKLSADEQFSERYDYVEQAIDADTFLNQEFIGQLLVRHSLYNNPQISPEVRNKFTTLTLSSAQSLADEKPFLTRISSFYAAYLQRGEQYALAEKYYVQALETSPDKISLLWALGQNQLSQNKIVGAVESLRRAAELAPEFDQAQQSYSNILKGISEQTNASSSK